MEGMGDKRAGDRKGEELGHGYYQGPLPHPAATPSLAFRPEDIGYFDPHLDDAYGKGDFVQLGKDVYYCDVHLFLGQAKAAAMVKGTHLIRISLHICLRGSAQQWYVAELSDLQRDGLHGGLGIENWVDTLMARFKQSEQAALDALLALRFTLDDLRNDRISLTAYVQAMVRNGRNAGLPTSNQLSLAWNKLDPELQRDVPRPRYDTTVASFIEQLEERKDMWKRLFSQPPYRYGQRGYELQPRSRSPPYNFAGNDRQPRRSDYLSNNASENAANRGYGTNNQGYETNNRGYGAQQPNRTPPYDFTSNDRQLRRPEYSNDRRNKPQFERRNGALPPPRPAYFIETNEPYGAYGPNDALPADNNTENEPPHHADVSEPPRHADVFFNDSAQPTRYGDPPYSCRPCGMPLGTSENLRNHTLDWHGVDTHSSTTKAATQQANYIEHALQNVVVIPQPSVHGYTAVKATLFWHDAEQEMTICLDTGSTTTFIDQSLVNKAKIKRTPPITAEGFSGKQVLDQLVELPITIATSSSPIRLDTIAYLVDDLRAGVLLGTDTLTREGANIDLKRNKLTIGYREADLVFKTPQNPTGMHITTRPTMHEILRQRRLNYAALSSQFRVKTPPQQGKSPALTASSTLPPTLLCGGTTPNRHTNVVPHLTVADLYNRFRHDTKTPRGSIPIWKKPTTPPPYGTKPYLTVHDLRKRFAHTTTSLTSHRRTDSKTPRCHVAIEPFGHNASTPPHKHITVAAFSSL